MLFYWSECIYIYLTANRMDVSNYGDIKCIPVFHMRTLFILYYIELSSPKIYNFHWICFISNLNTEFNSTIYMYVCPIWWNGTKFKIAAFCRLLQWRCSWNGSETVSCFLFRFLFRRGPSCMCVACAVDCRKMTVFHVQNEIISYDCPYKDDPLRSVQ